MPPKMRDPAKKRPAPRKSLSKTFSDNFLAAATSDEPIVDVFGRPGEKGVTLVKTDGPFRGIVQAFRWKFYLAPGFNKEQIDRWNEHNFPTITNVRLADIILLPARPGQSGFTMQHDALLRMLHNRKSYPGHFKPKAYKMDWIEACLRENAWLRDEMWDVKLPDLSDTEDEEDEGEENKENRQQGKGGKKNKGESKVMEGAKKP